MIKTRRLLALVVVLICFSAAFYLLSVDGNKQSQVLISSSSEALLAASVPVQMCLAPYFEDSGKAAEASAEPVGGELPPILLLRN